MGKISSKKLFILTAGIIILACLSLGCLKKKRSNPLDPGSDAYIPPHVPSKVMILSDDFESYINSSMLTNGHVWKFKPYSGGFSVQNGIGAGNSRAVEISAGQIDFGGKIYRSYNLSGEFYIEFYMKLKGTANANVSSFELTDNTGAVTYLQTGWTNGVKNYFYYFNGTSSTVTTNSAMNNTWYIFKIKVSTISPKKFSIWYKVDGALDFTLYADTISLPVITDTVPSFEFKFKSKIVGATEYGDFDNLEIYKME